ncbi:MAG: hypothetical protein Q9172_002447 [Xanthocarpia lactea]
MNLPPPIHDNSDNEEEDMAAAMGFSSFGTQPQAHPSKRKKTSHNTEAERNIAATGGNTLPLGIPKARPQRVEAMEGIQQIGGKEGAGDTYAGREMMEEGEPDILEGAEKHQRLDDPLEEENKKDEETSILLQRQAQLLRRINESYVSHPHPQRPPQMETIPDPNGEEEKNSEPAAHTITQNENTKANPTTSMKANETPQSKAQKTTGPNAATKEGFEGHTWAEWKRGIRNERGDMAFYDASFVEDPWRNLRAKTGGGGGGGKRGR